MRRMTIVMLVGLCFLPCRLDSGQLDPLQKCARKALAGHFGDLKPWQKHGYYLALRKQVQAAGLAWLTSYYPAEGFRRGSPTASGRPVSERSAAVSRKRFRSLKGHYVWTEKYGLRIIEDCGANYNDHVARRKGAHIWIDYWHHANKCPDICKYAIWR